MHYAHHQIKFNPINSTNLGLGRKEGIEEKMSFEDLESGRLVARGGRSTSSSNGKQQDPTRALASGVFQITTHVGAFQRLVNTLGTPKDTPELRDKLFVSLSLSLSFVCN